MTEQTAVPAADCPGGVEQQEQPVVLTSVKRPRRVEVVCIVTNPLGRPGDRIKVDPKNYLVRLGLAQGWLVK